MWKSWKFWTVWIALGGLISLFAFGFTTDPKKVPSPLIGHEAPNFQLVNLWNGESVELSALRGKPIVLNFWASWCVECQQEAHILEAFHKRYGETVPPQVHVLGVLVVGQDQLRRLGDVGRVSLIRRVELQRVGVSLHNEFLSTDPQSRVSPFHRKKYHKKIHLRV